MAQHSYQEIFSETNVLNQAFMSITELVSCYRAELGQLFQKLIEGYNSIILQQFEAFYRNENEKERDLTYKIAEQ